jgi:hypothetical protein
MAIATVGCGIAAKRTVPDVPADVLGPPDLNPAPLARQLLLERARLPALDAVERLVGLQAQLPDNPYVGLWSRLEGFDPGELARLLLERRVVRIVVMRGTIHLVSADDCLVLRPLTQPVLDAELRRHPTFAPALEGVDLAAVLAHARELFAAGPRTGPQLRAALGERFPAHDPAALAYACRCLLALVQVPPRGVWGQTRQVTLTTAEAWLGRRLEPEPSIDDVVVRYLAAFGPATVADIASWSRLTGMRAVVERLGRRLRTFRDERGRTLYDLPGAPRPGPATPAPVRFLPEYDNVLLSHADRSRFWDDGERPVVTAPAVHGTVLCDGTICATWRRDGDALAVDLVRSLSRGDADALRAEGARLAAFAGAAGGVKLDR